ncbi:ATP-binding protein [Tessaracoccus antarcticus]|uniref:ATP-binding protein n=1 Tax=Tessaracoccus antarcticus TaxID=2479848 RepID=UPI001313F8C4|nr:AAA family ATPase [Tessaracoccus antarcticus]
MQQLVGRQVEIARMLAGVDALPHRGGGLVIRGEAGIGKSALLSVAIQRAMARGSRVLHLAATESEAALPYAALQQILRPLIRRPDSMRARPRGVLDRAFGDAIGATPDLFAVGIAALEVLSDLAPGSGLILVVDDAQWMDESTARVLAFVSRRLTLDPVLSIFAVRCGHVSPLLKAGLETIDVNALTVDDAIELLRTRRPSLEAQGQVRVLRRSGGNPLGLLELSADFSEGDEEESLGERLCSAFLARVHGVSDPTATLMLVGALNDDDAVLDIQGSGVALGFTPDEIRMALGEAEGTGVVQLGAGRFTFLHPLVRAAIISSAPGEQRRRAHSALAQALEHDPDRALWHRAASLLGADEDVASALEDAALRATRQGDVAVSMRTWRTAARLSVDAAGRQRRALRWAEAALEAGQRDTASDALAGLDADDLDDVEAGRLSLVELGLEPCTAHPRALGRTVNQARRVLARGETDLAIELVLAVGEEISAAGGSFPEEFVLLGRSIAAVLPASDPRRLVVLAMSEPAQHADLIAEAVLRLDASAMDAAAEMLVRVRLNVDADPVLAAMQRRLLDSYRAHGRLRSIASLQPIHAWVEICLANWPEALQAVEEGTRLADELGLPRWGTGTVIGEGFIAALRGEHDRAEMLIHESEKGALAVGAHNVLTGVQLARGVNHLAQGRYDEAFVALRRALDQHDPSYHPVQSGWSLGDLAESAAHLGRIDEVRSLFQRDARVAVTPWRRVAEAYAAPFLATETAEVEEAYVEALRGAVAAWPTYRARLLLGYGSWLRRQRRNQEARDLLRTARDAADALSLRPWSERARSDLRALGTDSQARIPGAWEPLSSQELQVAELAARGLSNREIGERMFLSHRTVGSHLYRIYPKLGITNRAQLSSALHPRTAEE